jgi:hypothetical protein
VILDFKSAGKYGAIQIDCDGFTGIGEDVGVDDGSEVDGMGVAGTPVPGGSVWVSKNGWNGVSVVVP